MNSENGFRKWMPIEFNTTAEFYNSINHENDLDTNKMPSEGYNG